MIADFFLDLLFGVDKRLRERKADQERIRREQIAQARRELLDELKNDR